MALTGRMRDFGISEILQLIGQQKKSGVLTVSDKSRKVDILFDQGNIVGASHEPPSAEFDLGRMLVHSGMITGSQLEAARQEQKQTLKPLEQVLLNSKALGLSELKAMVTLSHLEIINSLFLWKDGDYSFEAGPVTYPQQWTESISSEEVLMDGYRIKDEWPLLEEVVPDKRAVLERAPGPYESKLSREQEKILRLIDGDRTAQDVIFLAKQGTFDTLKVIRELVEGGRVTVAGAVSGPAQRNLSAVFLWAAAALVIMAGLLSTGAGIKESAEMLLTPDLSDPATFAGEALAALHREERVGSYLSLHALMIGGYPSSLDELAEWGGLDMEEFETAWGRFEYQVDPAGRTCELSVPGEVSERTLTGQGG